MKDLQSCLPILAEGGKLAKEHLLQTSGYLNNQPGAVGVSEGEKPAKKHLLQASGHLDNQSEAVGFPEGEKPAEKCRLQIVIHLNDQSEAVGCMRHIVLSFIAFLRMFKC